MDRIRGRSYAGAARRGSSQVGPDHPRTQTDERGQSRRRGRHRKLSYHQQRALETLPGKMEELQSSITEMETQLLPIQNSAG